MPITFEKLQAMSSEERHILWQNARNKIGKHPDAEELVSLIETSGLDYKPNKRASVTLDSKIGRTMERIIKSETGVKAMLASMAKGLPPLAGVDPMLQDALGDDYSKNNEATAQAGYLVTQIMEKLGYKKVDSKSMPTGCAARSGLIFISSEN